jgi:REP element-mobilizing transposase RayT
MPQTLSFNLVHVIFSTKNRLPLISEAIAGDLHAYLAMTARHLGCECFRAGGVADHVHLAIRLSPAKAGARIVSELKTSSTVLMKERGIANFAWQRGYGMFSVSPADVGALLTYIDQQPLHHHKRSFQDEMRAFFEKYHVAFDERYVWD